MHCVENSRQCLIIVFWVWGTITFSPGVLLSEQMSPPILFDMGTEKSPVERGYQLLGMAEQFPAPDAQTWLALLSEIKSGDFHSGSRP